MFDKRRTRDTYRVGPSSSELLKPGGAVVSPSFNSESQTLKKTNNKYKLWLICLHVLCIICPHRDGDFRTPPCFSTLRKGRGHNESQTLNVSITRVLFCTRMWMSRKGRPLQVQSNCDLLNGFRAREKCFPPAPPSRITRDEELGQSMRANAVSGLLIPLVMHGWNQLWFCVQIWV